MGIIKAVNQAIGGAFADQWLEVYEADNKIGRASCRERV